MIDDIRVGTDRERDRSFDRGAAAWRVIRYGLPLMALMFIASCYAGDVAACPTCKDSIAAHGAGIARGFYWSILFMLGMPVSILSAWVLYIVRVLRSRPVAEPTVGKLGGQPL